MKIAVRYDSSSGNTKKVAEAIAGALKVEARSISEPLSEPVDLLFVGSGLYAGSVREGLKTFLSDLTAEQVGRVAVFSTAAGNKLPDGQIEALLKLKGIPVSPKSYHCRARFLFLNKGRPNAQDLKDAEAFARDAQQEQA